MNLSALPKRVARDAVRWAPKGLYTRAVGWGARQVLPRVVRRPVYSAFAAWVGADIAEVELPLEEYPSLGSFFARRLRAGVRTFASEDDAVVAPADGAVVACGRARAGEVIQAKGHAYQLAELLADDELAAELADAEYLTVYLSPRDYHRVHAPVPARLRGYRYVPGRLQSVAMPFVENVPRLFSRNERVVLDFDTDTGRAALVMVGAAGVGNLRLTFPDAGPAPFETRPFRAAGRVVRRIYDQPVPISRGDELGAFHLGSTVIFIASGMARLAIENVGSLRVGQVVGRLATSSTSSAPGTVAFAGHRGRG